MCINKNYVLSCKIQLACSIPIAKVSYRQNNKWLHLEHALM